MSNLLRDNPFGSLSPRIAAEVVIDVFDPSPCGAGKYPASRWHADSTAALNTLLDPLDRLANEVEVEAATLPVRGPVAPPREVEMFGVTFANASDVFADPVLAGRAWVVVRPACPPVVRFEARHREGAEALASEIRRLVAVERRLLADAG